MQTGGARDLRSPFVHLSPLSLPLLSLSDTQTQTHKQQTTKKGRARDPILKPKMGRIKRRAEERERRKKVSTVGRKGHGELVFNGD